MTIELFFVVNSGCPWVHSEKGLKSFGCDAKNLLLNYDWYCNGNASDSKWIKQN